MQQSAVFGAVPDEQHALYESLCQRGPGIFTALLDHLDDHEMAHPELIAARAAHGRDLDRQSIVAHPLAAAIVGRAVEHLCDHGAAASLDDPDVNRRLSGKNPHVRDPRLNRAWDLALLNVCEISTAQVLPIVAAWPARWARYADGRARYVLQAELDAAAAEVFWTLTADADEQMSIAEAIAAATSITR